MFICIDEDGFNGRGETFNKEKTMFICIDEDGFNGRGETADKAYEEYMMIEELDTIKPPSKCEFFSATLVKCVMKTEPMPKAVAKKPAAKK